MSCGGGDDEGSEITNPCISDQIFSQSRGECNVSLSFETIYNENITENSRIISSNSIPNHIVCFRPTIPSHS